MFSFLSFVLRPLTDLHRARADAARDRQDWKLAASFYRRFLNLNDKNSAIWVQLGNMLKESGDVQAAERAYRRALEISPGVADTYLQLGHALKLKEDRAGAHSAYLRATVLDPSNPHPIVELRAYGWSKEEIREYADPKFNPKKICREPTRPELTKSFVKENAPFDGGAYAEQFPDVRTLLELGLIASPDQHYYHYGFREGRDVIATLESTPPARIFVLCPSFHKRCGIGEHARYLADCLERSGLETIRLRTAAALLTYSTDQLRDSVILVNHGPGLFDGYNPELSEGEATTDVITILLSIFKKYNGRPICFMHSLLDRDNAVMFPRQQLWLESAIPIVTTIEAAGRVFNIWRVEHGMQPAPVPTQTSLHKLSRDYPTIGFFGFFQWGGKNFDALFNVVKRLKGRLVGSVATGNEGDLLRLRNLIAEYGIQCDLGTGWVDDNELMERLSAADFYYLPQHDYDHWNNSGTGRLVMNFGRPVMLPPHNPFLDLRDYAIFVDDQDLPAVIAWMRSEDVYEVASARAKAYAEKYPMTRMMPILATSLHLVVAESGARNFITRSAFTASRLLVTSFDEFAACLKHQQSKQAETLLPTPADSEARLEQIRDIYNNEPDVITAALPILDSVQYWKDHYDIDSFYFPTALATFVNMYRCFLKREPNLIDRDRVRVLLQCDFTTEELLPPRRVLALMSLLMDRSPVIEFAPRVQIYDNGLAIGGETLAREDFIVSVSERWTSRMERIFSIATNRVSKLRFDPLCDRNIPQLLVLPSEWIDEALTSSARVAGFDICVEGIGEKFGLLARYQGLMDVLRRADVRISDIGLFDKPIVMPVNFTRNIYSVADFSPYSGDALVFQLFRSLVRRDPLPYELLVYGTMLETTSKIEVVRKVARRADCQATLFEPCDANSVVALDLNADKFNMLIDQFRSAYAGGWDLRNFYLESRRNYDRAWLKIKSMKDIWWAQADGDLDRIFSGEEREA